MSALIEVRTCREQCPGLADPATTPGRQRRSGAHPAFEQQQQLGQRIAHGEVDRGDHQVDLHRPERLRRDELRLAHQLAGGDRHQQRGRFEEVDPHRRGPGQGQPQRLRHDHLAERAHSAHAERLSTLLLAGRHPAESRAEDLRQVSRVEDHQTERAGSQRTQAQADRPQAEVGDEDDGQQRDVLEQLGVDRRREANDTAS
jgi:hypothetical protein